MSEEDMAPLHMFLTPASPRDIVERMLRNLKNIYVQQDQATLLLGVLNRLVMLRPDDAESYRDRGLVFAQMGKREAALKDLQAYVRTAQAAQDLPVIEAHIELLRAES